MVLLIAPFLVIYGNGSLFACGLGAQALYSGESGGTFTLHVLTPGRDGKIRIAIVAESSHLPRLEHSVPACPSLGP